MDTSQSGFDNIIEDYSKENNPPYPPLFSQTPLELQSAPAVKDLDLILEYSRRIKWISILSIYGSIWYFIANAWPLALACVFPICGFIGAHWFSDCLIRFYIVICA